MFFLVALALASFALSPALAGGGVFNLLDYGGKGDGGATDNTLAFASAVAAVAAAGGGTLLVPGDGGAAVFSTRAFNLTSSMTLFLADGAVIQSSLDYPAWPLVAPLRAYPGDGPRYSPLIGGYGLHDVRITGNSSASGKRAGVDGLGLLWDVAYFAKLLKGQRPHALELAGCTGVELDGVAFTEAAYWTVHFSECVNVHVHDLTIASTTENGDGMDVGARNFLAERCSIATADDAIAIKSGDAPAGSGLPPATNITIRDSSLASGEACVAIGSEMTASVADVLVRNVTCEAAGHALLYVKERRFAGGSVTNVTVVNATIAGPIERFLWISQHFGENGENAEGPREEGGEGAGPYPVAANITLRDVAVAPGGGVVQAALLNGALAPPGGGIVGLVLENVALGATLEGWACANASGVWRSVAPEPCSELTPE